MHNQMDGLIDNQNMIDRNEIGVGYEQIVEQTE